MTKQEIQLIEELIYECMEYANAEDVENKIMYREHIEEIKRKLLN